MATLNPIPNPETPKYCMRRLRRCIDKLVANPTSAAAQMKAMMDPERGRSYSNGEVWSAGARLPAGRMKRGRKASHGGEEARSIRIGFAAPIAQPQPLPQFLFIDGSADLSANGSPKMFYLG